MAMEKVAKELIMAKILARDLQEAAQRNLERNDKLVSILFDPNVDLGEKYKAFFQLCGGEKLKKIKKQALRELNLIYSSWLILKKHKEKIERIRNEQKEDIPIPEYDNTITILETAFNDLLLRMLQVAFPDVAKTLWGIRGLSEESKRKRVSLESLALEEEEEEE